MWQIFLWFKCLGQDLLRCSYYLQLYGKYQYELYWIFKSTNKAISDLEVHLALPNLYSNQLTYLQSLRLDSCKAYVVRMASLIRLRNIINFLIHLCI